MRMTAGQAIYVWVLLCILVGRGNCEESPVIRTTSGLVRGKTVTAGSGKSVHAFLGIPYGQPPVGALRFQRPLPAKPWDGVFNASSNAVSCIQYIVPIIRSLPVFHIWLPGEQMSEDCLTLDVWTPKPMPSNASVMVYIYGGGFSMGSTNIPAYQAGNWPAEQGVIFVAMNYRIASLGFLYLDHAETPGNAGLMDQVLALKWVRDNIEFFGGNPKRVTIFGQSAGGASVGFHLFSPLSRDLFNNAILESGAPLSEWVTQSKEENIGYSLRMAEFAGCPHDRDNVSATVECLRGLDPMDIINNEPFRGYDSNIFRPIVDGYFIPEDLNEAAMSGAFKKTEIMLGTVKNEATHFLAGLLPWVFQPISKNIKPTPEDFTEIISLATRYKNPLTIKTIQFHYTNWVDPRSHMGIVYSADKMFGDFYFTCGLGQVAKAYANAENPVYQYYFTHLSANSINPPWVGTHHGHELIYVFGHPILNPKDFLKSEVILSKRIMTYWANFAKTGDPNRGPNGKEVNIKWPVYTSDRRKYLVLAPNSTAVGAHFREQQCAFWTEFMPYLMKEVENANNTIAL